MNLVCWLWIIFNVIILVLFLTITSPSLYLPFILFPFEFLVLASQAAFLSLLMKRSSRFPYIFEREPPPLQQQPSSTTKTPNEETKQQEKNLSSVRIT